MSGESTPNLGLRLGGPLLTSRYEDHTSWVTDENAELLDQAFGRLQAALGQLGITLGPGLFIDGGTF